jgi:methylenetetrahydrofolate dehydrogenase (NADP+) / methenyltetrahydrofolate cyclohydrolase
MVQRLSGAPVSQKIQTEILSELSVWSQKKWPMPKLVVILVGEDPASAVYVGHKEKMCQTLGFTTCVVRLNSEISEKELAIEIEKLNQDSSVDAILVQLPLPGKINERQILEIINQDKDADCLTEKNLGQMLTGSGRIFPCTPSGVIEIFKYYDISVVGKKVAVIGRSLIVGTPLFHLLTKENATVTLFHSKSVGLSEDIKNFDIVCVAMGKPHFFKASDFKKNCIVIDVGIHRLNQKIVGDVDFSETENLSAYTPVPGGVGPMTIAILMRNTLNLAKARRS